MYWIVPKHIHKSVITELIETEKLHNDFNLMFMHFKIKLSDF